MLDPRIRVAFVPVWKENPYHVELANSLARGGVHILSEHCLKALFATQASTAEKMEILHLHALPYFTPTPVSVARYFLFYSRVKRLQAAGVRVVWTVHDFQNHDSTYWRLEDLVSRLASRRFDALIVHGATAKRMVVSQWACPDDRITVIPHGNYIQSYRNDNDRSAARAAMGLEDSSTVFLFLGLIRPYKGVVEMLQAFKAYAEPGARLIIAGKPAHESIRSQVARLAASDSRVRFTPGFVEDDRIQDFMNACDVVVLPYKRILTSGAAILAMSFRKACIAPRAGCITDALDDCGTFFFDPATPGDLDRALREAFQNRHRLAEMGAYNYRRASEWDWDGIGKATAAVYRKCLARGVVSTEESPAALS